MLQIGTDPFFTASLNPIKVKLRKVLRTRRTERERLWKVVRFMLVSTLYAVVHLKQSPHVEYQGFSPFLALTYLFGCLMDFIDLKFGRKPYHGSPFTYMEDLRNLRKKYAVPTF